MDLILGRNPVLEALRAGSPIDSVSIKEGVNFDEKISEIFALMKSKNIKHRFVSKRMLDNMSDGAIHQGICALRSVKEKRTFLQILTDLEDKTIDPFIVYIREVQNEFNAGGIIRTAESVGANVIVLAPKQMVTPQIIRSSMGASEHINIVNENLFNAIKIAKGHLIKVIGIELSGDKYYYEVDLKGPAMLIIGGEDKSLSKEVLDKCDITVKIPQKGKINSLNMAVAVGVVLYEKLKQDNS